MTTLTTIEIEPPYLLFIGDMDYELDAKTAFGIVHWRQELCMAQLRFNTQVDLGLPDMLNSKPFFSRTSIIGREK